MGVANNARVAAGCRSRVCGAGVEVGGVRNREEEVVDAAEGRDVCLGDGSKGSGLVEAWWWWWVGSCCL